MCPNAPQLALGRASGHCRNVFFFFAFGTNHMPRQRTHCLISAKHLHTNSQSIATYYAGLPVMPRVQHMPCGLGSISKANESLVDTRIIHLFTILVSFT